jgi:hypothetical protein
MATQQTTRSSTETTRSRFTLRALLCFIAVFAGFLAWLLIYNQPPPHPMIGREFYHCDKCDALEGGIYGKGTPRRINSVNRYWCVHTWREIDEARFKALTTEIYGID